MKQMFVQFIGDNLNRQGLVISTGQILKYWIKMRQRKYRGRNKFKVVMVDYFSFLEVFGKYGIQ